MLLDALGDCQKGPAKDYRLRVWRRGHYCGEARSFRAAHDDFHKSVAVAAVAYDDLHVADPVVGREFLESLLTWPTGRSAVTTRAAPSKNPYSHNRTRLPSCTKRTLRVSAKGPLSARVIAVSDCGGMTIDEAAGHLIAQPPLIVLSRVAPTRAAWLGEERHAAERRVAWELI